MTRGRRGISGRGINLFKALRRNFRAAWRRPSPQGPPRRGFGRVPSLMNRGLRFPGAESIFSRLCGGISGRRDVALSTRAARAGSWRRFPLAAMGAEFPGAELTFSMACGRNFRATASPRRGRTRAGPPPSHGARRGRCRTLASDGAKGAQGSGGTRGVRRSSGSPRLTRYADGFHCLGTSERRRVAASKPVRPMHADLQGRRKPRGNPGAGERPFAPKPCIRALAGMSARNGRRPISRLG